MAMNARKRLAGVTLVEVLAGLVLVAIVLPAALRAIGVGMSTADMARHRLEAVSLAQSKLDELIVTGEWDRGSPAGAFDEPWEHYAWRFERAAFDNDVEQLTVTVSWKARGREQALSLSTLFATTSEE